MISTAPIGRQLIEVHKEARPNLPRHASDGAPGTRIEGVVLSRVGADRLDPEAENVALDQEAHRRRIEARVCGPSSLMFRKAAGSVRFDQSVRIRTHAPAGCARAATPTLPSRAPEEVLVRGRGPTRRSRTPGDELCTGIVVRVALGVILARDPVNRRVEVRPGVLAARDVVPVPGRAASGQCGSPPGGTG